MSVGLQISDIHGVVPDSKNHFYFDPIIPHSLKEIIGPVED
jgi:hypothetical protein